MTAKQLISPSYIQKWLLRTAILLVICTIIFSAGILVAAQRPNWPVLVYDVYTLITNGSNVLIYRLSHQYQTEETSRNLFRVTQNDPSLSGTILFAMRGDPRSTGYPSRVVEVDRTGQVVWEYQTGDMMLTDVRKLANGNVLIAAMYYWPIINGRTDASWILEVDRQGQLVHKIQVPLTHHAEQIPNGNYLAVDARNNVVNEADVTGKVVWEWDGSKHIQPYSSANYHGLFQKNFLGSETIRNMYAEFREGTPAGRAADWLHINSAQRLDNGNTILSLRNLDLVIEVNPEGETVWSYGALILKHQHCAWILPNGHLLVTDNGNARVIEVDRSTQQIVWEYDDGLEMVQQACAYRLPNGNTLITDSENLRIIEVTASKRLLWELKVETPGTMNLYRAWWSPD